MSISKDEFQTAMEIYGGGTFLDGHIGTRVRHISPCFLVGELVLLHSGSDYVVITNEDIPQDLISEVISELGTYNPYRCNWLQQGELHSLEEVLTLVTMLDKKYSKEAVAELIHKTRQKFLSPTLQAVLNCPAAKSIVSFSSRYKSDSAVLQSLWQTVEEYDKTVNPFADTNLKPCPINDWPDSIILDKEYVKSDIAEFSLHSKSASVRTYLTVPAYTSWFVSQDVSFYAGHCYNLSCGGSVIEEVVYFDYSNKDVEKNLRISLTSGLAWHSLEIDKSPATDEQFEMMSSFLKKSIDKVREEITSKIFVKA